ncbi:hypothetical protein BH09BAC2_BH09BAC2_19990 [soil metagenome]
MPVINFEFKAITDDLALAEEKLISLNPVFHGVDHQMDTYFNVNIGRLKLREGNIENALIWYNRQNTSGAKISEILLYTHAPDKNLKEILLKVHGTKVIVEKVRKIYFIDNVKFHFDTISQLGTFIEVEAIDKTGEIGVDKLKQQCEVYIKLFGIKPEDFVGVSYSDMLLAK